MLLYAISIKKILVLIFIKDLPDFQTQGRRESRRDFEQRVDDFVLWLSSRKEKAAEQHAMLPLCVSNMLHAVIGHE